MNRRLQLALAVTVMTACVSATTPPAGAAGPQLRAVRIASLDQPVAFTAVPGSDALLVAEKTGKVRRIRNGRLERRAVVDVSAEISNGGEQGLLGVAAAGNNVVYVHFTDKAGDHRLVEFGPGAARRELLNLDHTQYTNHNGGQVVIGPDHMLYLALGDGGGKGDPFGNAQRLDTHEGKILRIDPRPSGSKPYTVPRDNPFVGRAGAVPEIWAYGLRNPWRFSFDRATGDLWVGDVGENRWEEIDKVAKPRGGMNFGWSRREGRADFKGTRRAGDVEPVHQFPTSGACAVTGGYVYRGSRIPALRGRYLFADFCKGRVRTLDAARPGSPQDTGLAVRRLTSFGEDTSGELYVLSIEGGVFRIEAGR